MVDLKVENPCRLHQNLAGYNGDVHLLLADVWSFLKSPIFDVWMSAVVSVNSFQNQGVKLAKRQNFQTASLLYDPKHGKVLCQKKSGFYDWVYHGLPLYVDATNLKPHLEHCSKSLQTSRTNGSMNVAFCFDVRCAVPNWEVSGK